MKEQILKLRAEGKTYNEIQKELNCAKSTISYYCGENQKEKTLNRTKKLREDNKLLAKFYSFHERNILKKVSRFHEEKIGTTSKRIRTFSYKKNFTYKDVEEKFNGKCYLTGRTINISDSSSFHFDHIIPRSKGGKNELSNLGIATKEANMAKSDMDLNDFIELCKDVCENFGYKVSK